LAGNSTAISSNLLFRFLLLNDSILDCAIQEAAVEGRHHAAKVLVLQNLFIKRYFLESLPGFALLWLDAFSSVKIPVNFSMFRYCQ
jgi:hypothetical protein